MNHEGKNAIQKLYVCVNRPSKRKLITQEEYKGNKKKQKISASGDLQVDEELALRLIQN